MLTSRVRSKKSISSKDLTPVLTEDAYRDDLVLLFSHTNIQIQQEVSVDALEDSKTSSRRFDLVYRSNNKIQIIELKLKTIDELVIANIIGERGYLHLANKEYANKYKNIQLIFSNPAKQGLTPGGKRLLDTLNNCHYTPIERIGRSVYEQYKKALPKSAKWRAEKLLREYQHLIEV